MSRALVTGGTGFIGSALVRRLSAPLAGEPRHEEIVVVVRPGSPRISRLSGLPRVRCATLDELRPELGCDVVFNLASYGVSPSDRDPHQMLQGNVTLTCELLKFASAWRTTRFVHTGSCAEYAPQAPPTLIDEHAELDPPSLYGAAKVASSLFGRALARQLEVPWVCLRLFGTYGPGEAAHRLIPALANQLLRGQSAEMTAGNQVRDMCYVDDVIDALLIAANPNQRLDHPCYNLCTDRPISIAEFARSVARAVGVSDSKLGLGRLPMREGEQMWLVGSSARFRQATGWAPRIGVDEGVRLSVEHIRAQAAGAVESR